jgi:hypothetical protein
MVSHFGDFDTTETVNIPFNTFDSNDPSASVTITNLVAGDIKIHKDGAVAQRTSANGLTMSVNFDGITGNHLLAIDLSDNTHAGFYADGSTYQVRMEGTTVDAATVNSWIGSFSIGRMLRPTTAGRKLDVTANGEAGLDFDNTVGTLAAAQFAADFITGAKIAAGAIAKGDQLTGLNDLSAAQVNTEVDNAIVTYGLDHLVAASVAGADITDNSIIAKLVSKEATADWDDFVNTTDSLQAIRDRGDAEWVTATGFALANVLGALNDGAAADEVTTGDTVMQYVKQLINILVGAPGVVTLKAAAAPASGVSLSEMIRAIYDDTAVIGAAGVGLTDLGGMSTTMKGQVNAEVDTALVTTTYAEPAAVPAATSSIKDKINWLFALARNKGTQTSTTKTLRNDADGADIASSTISDDSTTFTRGKWT